MSDTNNVKELIYDGLPSKKLEHRPFFSIIIPCYNSREYIGELLASIEAQDMPDDIEIILSDDNSPESYQDIVDPFRERLCIKQVKTDYNFAPGNTRERGVKEATGEWIAFADHDDLYIVDTFSQVKEAILKSGEKYYLIGTGKDNVSFMTELDQNLEFADKTLPGFSEILDNSISLLIICASTLLISSLISESSWVFISRLRSKNRHGAAA